MLVGLGKAGDGNGLFIYPWSNRKELETLMGQALDRLLKEELGAEYDQCPENHQRLSRLFGLYPNGHVNNQGYEFQKHLCLERFQILSPYCSGHAGTLSTNAFIQSAFRPGVRINGDVVFHHSDKIIRMSNWYSGYGRNRQLILSNGSIGVVTGKDFKPHYYFIEFDYPKTKVDNPESFTLAYAITVHKAQGSDFDTVFLIIPNKAGLLCRELIYTALTRSKQRLFVFLQKTPENLFVKARNVSFLMNRRTAVFDQPELRRDRWFIPEQGIQVRSKVEYIIYQALDKSGLDPAYEQALTIPGKSFEIHPDFTLKLRDGRTIYWEHLGMLDVRKYARDWEERRRDYVAAGLIDQVVTTDDLKGLSDRKIQQVIDDIRAGTLATTTDSPFSRHHYPLY